MNVVDLFHKLWIPGKSRNPQPRLLTIKEGSEVFTKYFDEVQEQLETLATMDELLSGNNIMWIGGTKNATYMQAC